MTNKNFAQTNYLENALKQDHFNKEASSAVSDLVRLFVEAGNEYAVRLYVALHGLLDDPPQDWGAITYCDRLASLIPATKSLLPLLPSL